VEGPEPTAFGAVLVERRLASSAARPSQGTRRMSVSRRTCAKDLCEGPVRRTCAKGWGDSSRECLGAQTVRLYPYGHCNPRQEKVGEPRIKGANAGLREMP
jgi:hypothetical protein